MKTIRQRLQDKLSKLTPAQRADKLEAFIDSVDEAIAELASKGVGTSPSKEGIATVPGKK